MVELIVIGQREIAFNVAVIVECDVKFSDNVFDESGERSSTSAKMTVFHVRQPSPSSANKKLRTNLAHQKRADRANPLCQIPTV